MEVQARFNAVFAFIEANLQQAISLERLAEQAHFSPFHFHRLFKAVTGENVNAFLARRRVEKAASLLIDQRHLSIKTIAFEAGFNSDSSFTRAFKTFYGCSPSQFRKDHPHQFSKLRQVLSKNGQAYPDSEAYLRRLHHLINFTQMKATIEVVQSPNRKLATIACVGQSQLQNAFQQLLQWAIPNGIMQYEETKLATIFYDSLKVTPKERARMNAAIVLPGDVSIKKGLLKQTLDGGKHLRAQYELGIHEFEDAWTGLFLWMTEHGYEKADKPPFEIYHNNYNEHPEKKCVVDLYIPVR